MQSLIKRLEQATGPDGRLDRAIRDAFGLPAMLVPPDGGDEAHPYTASIDAAVTLVPEGWCWRYDSSMHEAEVSDYSGRFLIDADKEWHGSNRNPAIAICIAAIRARVNK